MHSTLEPCCISLNCISHPFLHLHFLKDHRGPCFSNLLFNSFWPVFGFLGLCLLLPSPTVAHCLCSFAAIAVSLHIHSHCTRCTVIKIGSNHVLFATVINMCTCYTTCMTVSRVAVWKVGKTSLIQQHETTYPFPKCCIGYWF